MTVAEAFAAPQRYSGLDRALLVNAGALVVVGLVISMAASPAAASRMGIEEAFHFASRHAIFVLVGLAALAAVARLSVVGVRRTGVVLFAVSLPLAAVAALAPEIKGAARWIDLGPVSLQPSEFLKPGLVVAWAWMLSEGMKRPDFPGRAVSLGLLAITAAVLLLQPDVGQTALCALTLAVMLFLAGLDWRWILGGVAAATAAAFGAYAGFDHVRARVDAFLQPDGPGGYQVGQALQAIESGGLFGRGPGEGVVKLQLPDAHADFVFAVAAEEFGLLASVGLIGLFAALVLRGLSRASRLVDPFAQLAAAGLVALLAVQAAIHLAVNVSLVPAKGMTLPFVSYGGSSMVASAIALGLILALTRATPGAYLYEREARDGG